MALSPLQEGLYALYRLASDERIDLYTMQFVVDVDGPLDVELLRHSARAMLDRHPNLRAAFWEHNLPRPVQIIPAETELPWIERSASTTEFDAIARSERHRPFDLSRGPALRITLLTAPGATRRRMIVTTHHILMDGWSLALFFTEMLAVYQAGGSCDGLPAPRPYRDYIVWLSEQNTAAATAVWMAYLDGASGPLMIADAAAGAATGVPQTTELLLPAAETTRLRQWAGRHGLTLNTVVLFAWIVVLGRLADRRDVVVGTVVSGRPDDLAGVENMVGLFINTVPVVHHLGSTTPAVEQCARLQRELSQMRDIGYLSLSHLQREHGRGALFDTLFVFENAPIDDAVRPGSAPDGARFCPVEMESLTHYPLTVVAHIKDGALAVLVEAIRAALPHLPAEQIGKRLVAVLRQLPGIGDNPPDKLETLTPAERGEYSAAQTVPAPDGATVWELFERQVRATPNADAVRTSGKERYSYAELHAAAGRLAGELAAQGVGPETVVALVLGRSTRSVVALWAVLAAGGAYVPVDVTLPRARIQSVLHQANPALVLTEIGREELVGAGLRTLVLDDPAVSARITGRSGVAPAVRRHPGHSAYVIFTSGSTGEPKGVIGTNAALVSYFADHRERVYRPATARVGRPLRIAHAWSLSFDACWQPMVGLLDGHGLHLFDAEEMADAEQLVAGIVGHGIDMIDTTPSMFVQLSAAGLGHHRLAVLALGGEAIDAALWKELHALPFGAVYNCYGPTETTVEAVVATVGDHQAPTIGTANAAGFGYVLDSTLRPVPTGVVGELYLSGPQLARGYVGGAALTADRFVADPFHPGQRMYRTGDLVRRLANRGYAYVGRADTQVKIRGYRVEIGEIEALLRSRPGVDAAAVSVVRHNGGAILVGFVAGHQNTEDDPARLRAALTELLPSYMVPARIVALPALPVDGNGKLDARSLQRLARETLSGGAGGCAPAAAHTDTERSLSEIFAELSADGETPDIDADFFSLGVDSIVAISLVNNARRGGIPLSPRMVLGAPSIRQLAAAVDALAGADATADSARYGEVPPLPMVSWLLEHGNYRRFAHSIALRLPADIDRASIELMLQLLLDGHETLRSILVDTDAGPRLCTRGPGTVRAADVLGRVRVPEWTEAGLAAAIARCARRVIDEIDPRAGAMVRAVWFCDTGRGGVLLICAHHLVVDVVSWHIMAGDVAAAWRSVRTGGAPNAPREFTSYRRWSQLMWGRAATPQVQAQREYWVAQVAGPEPALGTRHPDPGRDTWSTLRVTRVVTPAAVTERVLAGLTKDLGVREFLLAATAMVMASWRRARGQDPASGTLITLEGHGRADAVADTDTTGTVGWFTSAFPVRLGVGTAAVDIDRATGDPGAARALLDSVAGDLRAIPCDGLDYGLLRYVDGVPQLREAAEPQIHFSYLGRFDLGGRTDQPWSLLTGPAMDALPVDPEPDLPLRFALNISVLIGATSAGPQLITNWRWSDALFTGADIDTLTHLWQRSIAVLAQGR